MKVLYVAVQIAVEFDPIPENWLEENDTASLGSRQSNRVDRYPGCGESRPLRE